MYFLNPDDFSYKIPLNISVFYVSIMCETLDEIHEAQLAAVITRMRKEHSKTEQQSICN